MSSAVDELVAPSAWDLRDPQFTDLVVAEGVPCMLFAPSEITSEWTQVRTSWLMAPSHPALLEPVRMEGKGILLRYAPLSWRAELVGSDGECAKTLAHWGIQLAELFEKLVQSVPRERLQYLVRPWMWIDIRQQARVAFLSRWFGEQPRVHVRVNPTDEDVWIDLIVDMLQRITGTPPPAIGAILERCRTTSRWHRLKSLRAVRDAFDDVRGNHPLRELTPSRQWSLTEQALGWLALRGPEHALPVFCEARDGRPSQIVEWGVEKCKRLLAPSEPPESNTTARADHDFAADVAWHKRTGGFGPVFVYSGPREVIPATSLDCPGDEALGAALYEAWGAMPWHPNILDFVERRHGAVVLRYAAIDWSRPRFVQEEMVGGLVAQLCDVFHHVTKSVPQAAWPLFANPRCWFDLAGHVRVGFAPPDEPVPDAAFDERSFVYVIGKAVRRVWRPVGTVTDARIALCTDMQPEQRPASLAKVQAVFAAILDPSERVREGIRLHAWVRAEQALGWLQLDRHRDALDRFREANNLRSTVLTRWGLRVCKSALGLPREDRPSRFGTIKRDLTWTGTRAEIEKLESERAFTEAMALYHRLAVADDERADVYTAMARCHLALREPGLAIDDARKALAAEPGRAATRILLVRALVETKKQDEALSESEALVRDATYNADAHYLRGKALLSLGRVADARDAFDLALALRPTMLEALLLRREADRSLVKLGKTVGQQQVSIEIPESLEPLRDLLLGGRAKDVIAALSDPGWADDVGAQLMLARFCSFDGKYDRALAVYDRIGEGAEPHRRAALIGKAGVLLDQGRVESALAVFDAVLAEDPSAIDAIEGRARTLDTLGRIGEAAAEFRRFVALGSAGANLRVRVAQLWLDQH